MLKIDKSKWKPVKLSDVVFKTENNDKVNAKNLYDKFIKAEHLDVESLNIKRYGSQEKDELPPTFYKIFKSGQILYPTRNPHLRRAALANFDGICGEKTLTISVNEDIADVRFIAFLFHSNPFYFHTTNSIVGSTNPHVRWRDVIKYKFQLPPKAQQAELAGLLWAMDELIEKDLVVSEILKKTYNKFINEKIKRPTNEFLFFKELYSFRKGLTYKSEEYGDETSGKPLLNLKTIARGGGFNKDGVKYYDGKYQDKHIVKNTDLVVACTDITRGGAVVGFPLHPEVYQNKEMLFTMDLIAIESQNDLIERDYLYYLLKSDWAHNFLFAYSPGTTVLHLDTDGLDRLKIPKEPKKNQYEIISELKSMESMLEKLESKLESSKALQKALINQIF